VVYGMGSLYTSIIPSLILEGVGEAIAARAGPKVLILNGGQDRETGDMSAAGVVMAVVNALNRGGPGSVQAMQIRRLRLHHRRRRASRRGDPAGFGGARGAGCETRDPGGREEAGYPRR
jgi:hypothetical protein